MRLRWDRSSWPADARAPIWQLARPGLLADRPARAGRPCQTQFWWPAMLYVSVSRSCTVLVSTYCSWWPMCDVSDSHQQAKESAGWPAGSSSHAFPKIDFTVGSRWPREQSTAAAAAVAALRREVVNCAGVRGPAAGGSSEHDAAPLAQPPARHRLARRGALGEVEGAAHPLGLQIRSRAAELLRHQPAFCHFLSARRAPPSGARRAEPRQCRAPPPICVIVVFAAAAAAAAATAAASQKPDAAT
jgi:hypothetical protein